MKLNLGFPILMTSALILNGCAFSKDDKSKKDQNPTTIQQIPQPKEQDDLITARDFDDLVYVPRERLHEYDVIVKLKVPRRAKVYVDGLRQKLPIDGTQSLSQQFICRNAEDFRFQVRAFPFGSEVPSEFELGGKCPVDIELIGNARNPFPESMFIFGRLVLHDRTSLNLDGKSLNLEVDQLLVEGTAEIRSYQSSDVTKENVDMNQPPKISIKAKKAGPYGNAQAGQIEFHLIGLNGKPGINGDELEKENPAFQEERRKDRTGKNASADKKIDEILSDTPRNIPFIKLKVNPRHGEDGKPGLDGISGEAGQAGMDAPKLNLEIMEHSDFVVNVFLQPGQGGKGGAGGQGIPGGEGGAPYAPVLPKGYYYTETPKKGLKGYDGKTGEVGLKGKTGAATDPEISPNIKPFIR